MLHLFREGTRLDVATIRRGSDEGDLHATERNSHAFDAGTRLNLHTSYSFDLSASAFFSNIPHCICSEMPHIAFFPSRAWMDENFFHHSASWLSILWFVSGVVKTSKFLRFFKRFFLFLWLLVGASQKKGSWQQKTRKSCRALEKTSQVHSHFTGILKHFASSLHTSSEVGKLEISQRISSFFDTAGEKFGKFCSKIDSVGPELSEMEWRNGCTYLHRVVVRFIAGMKLWCGQRRQPKYRTPIAENGS